MSAAQLPAPPLAWEVFRRSTIVAARAANSILDTVFYDVKALTDAERRLLSKHLVPEGAVLVVYPSGDKRRIRALEAERFVFEQLSERIDPVNAVVVGGVGSSAIGTAAFARNVADYLGKPVAGIVSGYGLADVVTEGLGGWFVLGARNALREMSARLLDLYGLKDHVRDPGSHAAMKSLLASAGKRQEKFLYGSPDSATLLFLLQAMGRRIELLVGHSKGNYSIENALEGWISELRNGCMQVPPRLRIITLGAVIWFPPEFSNLHQFIGQIDYFGMLNSRIFVKRICVPGAWHSLNRDMRCSCLSVKEALAAADAFSPGGPGSPKRSRATMAGC
ncbi:MAG TPA: hypothetical protein PLA43_02840 [Bryobacteraceae bacterium]|nr:hypothetical protein [Bryobacteraceae bacterium]HOL71875.1 hypothetical protein [Bryobacteraceae bacterium]HOQ44548.1 hypothetical protein [Bryobacteraceae bacterium]HPU70867.1 hypothetical protein [Bryobacteraceae bacterium]